jgi:hypothetical protein
MARRSSFGRTMNAIGRASARAIREVEAAQRAQVRELERRQREALRLEKDGLRLRAAADKTAQKRYLELREQESQQLNADVAARLEALAGVLAATLGVDWNATDQPKTRLKPISGRVGSRVTRCGSPGHNFVARASPGTRSH